MGCKGSGAGPRAPRGLKGWDSVGGPGELQEAYGQGRGRSALGPVGPGLGEVEPSPQIGQRPELGQGAEDMAEGAAQRLRV